MKFTQRLTLAWRILRAKPGNLLAHAERELGTPQYGPDIDMAQCLKELVLVFATQGTAA